MAAPPGTNPSRICALASAIASTERKKPRCTGATVVMMAISGLISWVSAFSSPAWFMPASNTPKFVSCRILASDRGTPQWLLWDLSETCTRPEGISAIFSASLVPVLPTLPVTAITTASLARAREAAPRSFRASSVSATRSSRFSPRGALKSCSTMAHEAPCESAASTKACPSRFRPRSAIKASSGARLRLSMETPLTGVLGASEHLPRTAFTISPTVHSGLGTVSFPLQRGVDRIMIRIRNDGAFDNLPRLVSLAGNQQNIPAFQAGDGFRHGDGAAGDFDRAGSRRQDFAANLLWLFAPRIVVGDNGDIGSIHGNRAHLRALALVAVAAATEYHQQAVPHVRPKGVERIGQRIGGMRVVDEDRGTGTGGAGKIEAPPRTVQVLKQWQQFCGAHSGGHA